MLLGYYLNFIKNQFNMRFKYGIFNTNIKILISFRNTNKLFLPLISVRYCLNLKTHVSHEKQVRCCYNQTVKF